MADVQLSRTLNAPPAPLAGHCVNDGLPVVYPKTAASNGAAYNIDLSIFFIENMDVSFVFGYDGGVELMDDEPARFSHL